MDSSELPFSLGNAILFGAALFGIIASFSRPLRTPGYPASRKGWKKWNLSLLDFFLFVWAFVVLIFLVAPIIGAALVGDVRNEQLYSAYATPVMQTGIIAIVLFAVRTRKWPLKEFFTVPGVSWVKSSLHAGHLFLRFLPLIWLVGMFWGAILLLLENLGLGPPTEPQVAAQWIAQSDSFLYLTSMALMVVIGAPLSEELLFRGLLYRFLNEIFRARFALIASSLLFALLHASTYSFLPLFFIGLLLTKVYQDTHDLRTPIFFHLYFNLFSFLNLLFLPVQGS